MKGMVTVCSNCGYATEPQEISIEFERSGVQAIMSGIPAMVCPNCGEQYVPGEIAGDVIDTVARTIDDVAELLKRTELHRQALADVHPTQKLELALMPVAS